MLLALVAPETPPAPIANTSAARATKPTVMNFRLFIDEPSIALAGLLLFALRARRLGPADWLVPLTIPGEGSHTFRRMSRPLVHIYDEFGHPCRWIARDGTDHRSQVPSPSS